MVELVKVIKVGEGGDHLTKIQLKNYKGVVIKVRRGLLTDAQLVALKCDWAFVQFNTSCVKLIECEPHVARKIIDQYHTKMRAVMWANLTRK